MRDVLVLFRDDVQQRTEVVEVEQQQSLLVGESERDVEHAGLHVVQLQHASQERRTDLADGCPNWISGFPV